MFKDVNTEAASSATDNECPQCGPDTYTSSSARARHAGGLEDNEKEKGNDKNK